MEYLMGQDEISVWDPMRIDETGWDQSFNAPSPDFRARTETFSSFAKGSSG